MEIEPNVPPEPIRVVVLDDHRVFAESLATALATFYDIEVVAQCFEVDHALAQIASLTPKVAIIDYRVPAVAGHELIESILDIDPVPRVLVLTASDEPLTLATAIRAGANGFLGKSASLETVVAAIRSVASGGTHYPVEIEEAVRASTLTARELETLRAVSDGATMASAGDMLGISPNTVRNHLQAAKAKLGVSTRGELVSEARRRGLLPVI